MDESLPPDADNATWLRIALERERTRRVALEHEVDRLQAGLARQNARIIELEQRDAARERRFREMETLLAALTEQNRLLRQQVAGLEQENARLRGAPRASTPTPSLDLKPAAAPRAERPRKKRAAEHNRGRQRMAHATRWETHAVETCPQCGEQLHGGWIVRRVQVIDLAPRAPLEITEHRIVRRQCPRCGTRVLPPTVAREGRRLGRCRFGPRLIAALATMRTVEHLPIRVIQDRLQRESGLVLSVGGIVGLLQRMADTGKTAYDQLQADSRASPFVHADETGWREDGQRTTVWTVSTAQSVYVSHGRRTNAAIDAIIGADYAGTIIADCYAAYDHFVGPKQRCWAHLIREVQALLQDQGDDPETVAWAEGIFAIYEQARDARAAAPTGWTGQAVHERRTKAQQCEALILLLCPAVLAATCPYATLATRLRHHLTELFTFVRDPQIEPTNNAAERSLRPLVTIRKISGGTRSERGSATCMILYSLAATARQQGKDPTAIYESLLLAPPGAPSPLATPQSHAF